MLKKAIVLMVVLCVANVSFGDWLWWTNDAGNRLWEDTGNWTQYPTASDDVVIGTVASAGPILNTGVTGYANWMHLSEDTPTGSSLTVNGGTVQCSDHLLVGENWGAGHKGTLLLNSGVVNTTLLMVGGSTDGANGNGTVTMNGGTINISWLLAIAGGYSGTTGGGVGHVQIDAGTLNATGGGGLVMSDNGSMDITGGTLVLAGEITDITTYGDVTAYGGAGTFVYDFDGANTEITAIPEPATLALIGLGGLLLKRRRA